MRTIKFRGKRIDTGTWVYGHYLTCPLTIENFGVGRLSTPNEETIHCIADLGGVVFHVKKETISQFTGIKDCNDKDIYEGDIVLYTYEPASGPGDTYTTKVIYNENKCSFILSDRNGLEGFFYLSNNISNSYKIIGNAYETVES